MIKTYLLILIIFVIFINIQVYFYNIKYKKNDTLIKNIESFQNTLVNIDSNEQYLLDDKSLEILLGDYNNLKNNI
jgi:biopolymer transport protein ExbD